MLDKRIKPDFMPWLSPYLVVQDANRAVDFYQRAFGFDLRDCHRDESGKIQHAELIYHDAIIMLAPESNECVNATSPITSGVITPVGFYLYCENVDDMFQHAVAQGAQIDKEPEDAFWGDRMCGLVDTEGHRWSFATKLEGQNESQ